MFQFPGLNGKREEKAVDNTIDKTAEEIAASSNQPMQVMKKWKDMDQEQQQYYFRNAHGFYLEHLRQFRKPMGYSQKKVLIEKVYAMMGIGGISIPRAEVYRVLEKAITKWNTDFIQRRINKANRAVNVESQAK